MCVRSQVAGTNASLTEQQWKSEKKKKKLLEGMPWAGTKLWSSSRVCGRDQV